MRLLVSQSGDVVVEVAPWQERAHWAPDPGSSLPVRRVALALEPVDAANRFLYHKTTNRRIYEEALSARPGVDDVLLWNAEGEITESTIANVVVDIDGALYTPPVSSGLLPGVFRQDALARHILSERVLTKDDLETAGAVYMINSLRGWMRAEWV